MNLRHILVLCTNNSCRSLMAEALINHFYSDQCHAESAGIQPTQPHPLALAVLQELGIATDGLRSKSIEEFLERKDLDLVVTVCDAANESCPLFPGRVRRLHRSFPDPAQATGPNAIEEFRRVRDMIRAELPEWLQELSE